MTRSSNPRPAAMLHCVSLGSVSLGSVSLGSVDLIRVTSHEGWSASDLRRIGRTAQ